MKVVSDDDGKCYLTGFDLYYVLYFIKFVCIFKLPRLSFTQNVKTRNTTFTRLIKTQVHAVFKKYILMIEIILPVSLI